MWIGYFRFHGLLTATADPAGRPVAVIHQGVIWDADRAARAAGVHPGQSAALARTRCPGAELRTLDPAAAAPVFTRAWDLLADAASVVEPDAGWRPEAYAAWVCTDPPMPEVRSLQAALALRLPEVELAVGLGGSRLVARAACPPERGTVLRPTGTEARALVRYPLEVLAEERLITPVLLRRLGDLGLTRCGQVAALPAAVLRARFGREGERLHALCHGGDARAVRALYPPRSVSARRPYPDGLPPGAWAAAAAEVARQAVRALGPGDAARSLRLLVDGDEHVRTWRSPRRDVGVLARAAGTLAAQAAQGSQAPAQTLEVRLEGLAVRPAAVLSLLPGGPLGSPPDVQLDPSRRFSHSAWLHPGASWSGSALGASRLRLPALGDSLRPGPGLRPPTSPSAPDQLEDLLARLPRGALRRGCGIPDRYERMLGQLDPWGKAQ